MKNIILILLTFITMVSCTNQNTTSEKNVALIAQYVKAVENNDTSVMESLLDDNYIGLGPSVNDSIGKKAAIENWKFNIENLYESISYSKSRNISVNIPDGENKGEWVSNWAELKIVYKRDKKEVTVWVNTIYEIENDKIIKSFTFYNEADVLDQLGYVFINPNNL